MRRVWRLRNLWSALPLLVCAGSASGVVLVYSPNVQVDLSGTQAADEDVVADDLAGTVVPLDLGPIPGNVEVDGVETLADGGLLFSLDIAAELPGSVSVMPADVVRFDEAGYTVSFDASAEEVPDAANVDAIAVGGSGDLLLSFDTTVDLGGGLVVQDEDAVWFDGAGFSIGFDGSAEGVPGQLDLDGLGLEPAGTILASFDGAGRVAAIDFDDDTILRLDGMVWSLAFEPGAQHPDFEAGDVVALPEPGVWVGLAMGLPLLLRLAKARTGACQP